MPLSIMRRIRFCAGHRLINYSGKCAHFHGHNYLAEIHITGETTDDRGFLIDFGDLKRLLKGWIDDHWDHGFLLNAADQNGIDAIRSVNPSRLYLLPDNPTAENMATHLLQEVCPPLLAELGVQAWKVVIWETEDSFAEAIDPVAAPNGELIGR